MTHPPLFTHHLPMETTVEALRSLREKNIYIGTSSWKYGGWTGLVYQKDYDSEKKFKNECLAEYAQFFSAVGVDHTFYAWPNPSTFTQYTDQTPQDFRFGLKATERATVYQYPKLRRYGKLAGTKNEDFLNPDVFIDGFLTPLEPFKSRLGPIIFEFSQFYPGMIASGSEFVERLATFLKAVVAVEGFTFSVELRNKTWLAPTYFEMLSQLGVGHVFNSWTRMPSISEQLELLGKVELPFFVSRVLLVPGVKYAQAVESFSPYDKILSQSDTLRDDVAALIRRAIERGVPAYVFVNNRAEGCAPKTIEGILSRL